MVTVRGYFSALTAVDATDLSHGGWARRLILKALHPLRFDRFLIYSCYHKQNKCFTKSTEGPRILREPLRRQTHFVANHAYLVALVALASMLRLLLDSAAATS
jgi:hypothetical protein